MGRSKIHKPDVLLAVGNYDSNVGYAWRLMEQFWVELSFLGRKRNLLTCVCFPTISKIPQCLIEAGCEISQVDFTRTDIKSLILQITFILKNSVKVIYFTDFGTYSLRYALFRLIGVKKVIVHDHTPGLRITPPFFKMAFKVLAHRLPLISCTAALAVSPYVQQRLINVSCLPRRKVFLVTNGIDVHRGSQYRTPPAPELPIRIVTVGRVCYYKGIDFALRVLDNLNVNRSLPDFEYYIIGDGPDKEELEALSVELGVQDFVHFTGNIDNVLEKLHSCHIAFHPSKGEAMSLAILEYMRSGLAICTSTNPSVSSFLHNNEDALIYREADVESATECLQSLILNKTLRVKLASKANSVVSENFTKTKMMSGFRAAIDRIL